MSKRTELPAGNISPQALKDILIRAIDSGLVYGAMIVSGQDGAKLSTEQGDYPLVPSDYVMLSIGQPVSDEPGVKWLALTTIQRAPEGPKEVPNV